MIMSQPPASLSNYFWYRRWNNGPALIREILDNYTVGSIVHDYCKGDRHAYTLPKTSLNVCLFGFTGSGKSSVGNSLVTAINRANGSEIYASVFPVAAPVGSIRTATSFDLDSHTLFKDTSGIKVTLFDTRGYLNDSDYDEILNVSMGRHPVGAMIREGDDPGLKERLVRKRKTLGDTFMHLGILVVSGLDVVNESGNQNELSNFVNIYQLMRVKNRPAIVVVTKVDLAKDGPGKDVRRWAQLLRVDPADVYLMSSYAEANETDLESIDLMAATLLSGILVRSERAFQYAPLPWHETAISQVKQNPMIVLIVILSILVGVLGVLVVLLAKR